MNYRDFSYSLTWISVCWILAEGLIIGSPDPVVAAPGDDVILPCQLDPATKPRDFIVEWTKLDFEPDPSAGLSREHYVHLYRGGSEILDLKMPSYMGRTELFTEQLKHGNMSLKILNVTSGDAGRYKCFIPNLKEHAVIPLVVDPDSKIMTTETPLDLHTPGPGLGDTDFEDIVQTRHIYWILPVVFSSLVLIVIIAGVLMKRRGQTQTQKHDEESDVLKTPV